MQQSIIRLSPNSQLTVLALIVFGLTGCVHVGGHPWVAAADPRVELGTNVSACAALLGTVEADGAQALLDNAFSILVWNVRKGSHPAWQTDFQALTRDHDLVLLQEFALGEETPGMRYSSFTPGYVQRGRQTGVATLSETRPLVQCGLNGWEPILRTRKATTITEFSLADGATLVVVNVHAVNFSAGLKRFKEQIDDAVHAVAGHDGPLIFTGDFNTWRRARMQLVQEKLVQLRLAPVVFPDDQRSRILGRHLDHVYIRDLKVIEATTRDVSTSDHNPMIVRLGP